MSAAAPASNANPQTDAWIAERDAARRRRTANVRIAQTDANNEVMAMNRAPVMAAASPAAHPISNAVLAIAGGGGPSNDAANANASATGASDMTISATAPRKEPTRIARSGVRHCRRAIQVSLQEWRRAPARWRMRSRRLSCRVQSRRAPLRIEQQGLHLDQHALHAIEPLGQIAD